MNVTEGLASLVVSRVYDFFIVLMVLLAVFFGFQGLFKVNLLLVIFLIAFLIGFIVFGLFYMSHSLKILLKCLRKDIRSDRVKKRQIHSMGSRENE